jgi:SAM-dependent methyltransferase
MTSGTAAPSGSSEVIDMRQTIMGLFRRVGLMPPAPALSLAGDRDLEWSFVAGHLPAAGGSALDFGCGSAPLGLAAALRGYRVLALDLGPVQWAIAAPGLQFAQGDINTYDFGGQRFDLILNCSSVEHVGLAGRYGSQEDSDGDLKAMTRMRGLLKPGGQMLLTIPVGQDQVCRPLHRVYGSERLPRLIEGYAQRKAGYWVKRPGRDTWVPADYQEALAVKGGPAFYALGLFVLSLPEP